MKEFDRTMPEYTRKVLGRNFDGTVNEVDELLKTVSTIVNYLNLYCGTGTRMLAELDTNLGISV